MQSLDTLRGIAILMVIVFHVSVQFRPATWLAQLANLGNQGVQLFFLVSAITMSLMWEQRHAEPQRQLKFYIRRFFRIAPLFWLAMCFYGPSWWLNDGHGTMSSANWTQVALTATFLHGFSPSAINKIVPGGWSIAVEMSFYVVFPWLAARLITPLRTIAFGLSAYIALGVVATAMIEQLAPVDSTFMYYSMLTQFPIFAIGMFVYQAAVRPGSVDPRALAAIAMTWLAIALVGKYLLGLNTRPLFWIQVAIFAVLIWAMMRRGWSFDPLSYMGGLSYSMYLFHFAAIDVAVRLVAVKHRDGTASYLLALALVVAITTVMAKLSGITFERWSTSMARAVIARLRPSPTSRLSGA